MLQLSRYSLLFVFLVPVLSFSQRKNDPDLLVRLMKREGDKFKYFLDHKDSLEIQIIYTQIDRNANNVPVFRSFYFNVDSTRYFYPASTVKLPLSLIALEKLRELSVPGLNKFSTMLSDSVYSGQLSVRNDSTEENGKPSIAHYIKKMLITSDNDAYNRLYEFMGQREANRRLAKKGYRIRFLHRFERALSFDQNRHTEAIWFLNKDSTVLYYQPMNVNDSIPMRREVMKGVGFYKNDTLFHKPFDFSYKNWFPLEDQQQVLRALLFPSSVDPVKRFSISDSDRKFIMRYMSQLPYETRWPDYASDTAYYPAYAKYLMFGNSRDSIPREIRIFNKIGDAYGYLIDNAYIVDFDHRVEFMLSAVIFANTDGIFNDSKYEYKTIGYPFMKELGQLIYRYELKRSRKRKPDLSEFRFNYKN